MPESSYSVSSARVLELLTDRPPTLGSTKFVAIDGPAGSGKTILANGLADVLGASGQRVELLHLDDFYEGWTGLNAALERRVLDQVILPLSGQLATRVLDQVVRPLAGGRVARWQRYDWVSGQFAEWHDLPAPDVLILEGCGSGALSYDDFLTLLVWVEADLETRITRGQARDPDLDRTVWMSWMELEAEHFATNRTASRADLHVTTD